MMNIGFLDLFNASISASWLVLVIIVLRFLLKKAPRSIHCALWALVAIRLLCPVTIESPLSLVPSTQTVSNYYQTQEAALNSTPAVLDVVENPVYPADVDIPLDLPAHRVEWSLFEWSIIWPIGAAVMAGYALLSWVRIRRKVSASIPIAPNIRICDYISSPFILGVFRPVIYLPSDMEQTAVDHVLAHELAHLARRDHLWKPLGFALLSTHWFNPVMWLAYILLCRDIELACDERVIRDLDSAQKKSYSSALLQCSVSRPMIAACPLAFGEVGVKERVKNVLNYQKPAFWFVVLSIIICCVVAVCFLTDPAAPDVYDIMYQNGYTILTQRDHHFDISIPADVLPEEAFTSEGYTFEEEEVIVFETDTTSIWLMHVQYANEGSDKMYFEFGISHDLPKSGSILLSSRVKVGTHTSAGCFQPTSRTLYDGEASFEDAVSIRAHGPGQRFTVYIDTAAAQAAREELRFGAFMNELTYVKDGHDAVKIPTEEILLEGKYVSQEKFFWAWYSSLYVEAMTMDVGTDSVTLALQAGSMEGLNRTFPLERQWQTECPISENHRKILSELSGLESMFALRDLSDCRYLILDANHFIVEENGELYVVSWQMSSTHLEIIQYIFHMVPEAEYEKDSAVIPLGQATLEPDTVEEAIQDYILQYNMHFLGIDQAFFVSVDMYSYSAPNQELEASQCKAKLNVRMGQYEKQSDGSITELNFDYFTVQAEYTVKEDGSIEITGYRQIQTNAPENALQLEADCWNQAHAYFQPDTDAMLDSLQQTYPEYFSLPTDNGVELYWQDTPDGIRCMILPANNRAMTAADLADKPALTVPEAILILNAHQLPRSSMVFCRIQNDGTIVTVP